ncbi:MAG: alpha/beta fold hydrolase [Planctomycetota bacterium]
MLAPLAVALLLVTASPGTDDDEGRLIVTRQDLAEIVQGVDRLVADGALLPADGERSALARTNDEFDRITSRFFGARLSDAARRLAGLEDRLARIRAGAPRDGTPSGLRFDYWCPNARRWTSSVHLERGTAHVVKVRVRGMWTETGRAEQRVPIRGSALGQDGHYSLSGPALGELQFDARGRPVPTLVRIEVHESLHFPVLWMYAGEAPFERSGADPGRLESTSVEPLAAPAVEVRRAFEERLEAIDVPDEGARRAMRSRLALRWDAPSPERSSEFLLVSGPYRAELESDLAALERGEDPFRRRIGDHWRTFAHGRRDLAARVFLPESAPAESIPLVVALHGAGGDEGFFFELAGDGRVKALAEEHGCLVVAPFTPDFLWSPAPFDALLAGIADDYPIDPQRVFVIGHSMGGMVASRLCVERSDAIATACCVAGFRPIATESAPPVLVVQGERDAIVPASVVRRAVEASEGAEVAYVELEDEGHTLLLPTALDLAFAAWFDL